MARLARARNGVETPLPRASRRVVRVNESANPVFAAGHANQHEIFDHQRRERNAVALTVVRGADVPYDVAGFGVERDHVRVERAKKNPVAENSESAVHAAAAWTNVGRQGALILPDGAAGARIERESTIVSASGIEHAVNNERSCFEFSASHGLVSPLGHEGRSV